MESHGFLALGDSTFLFSGGTVSNNIPMRDVRKSILVVDDEQTIADTLAYILRGSGCSVSVAYSAETALEHCESNVPDLVISDVFMNGMNGVEMAIRIRARYPNCKILLFSGQAATKHLLDDARKAGHDFELLWKPIHPSDLLAKIKKPA